MAAKHTHEVSAGRAPEGLTDTQSSRRRLLRGSLAAAPAVLTLAASPVMATGSCTAASAFASMNTSRGTTSYSCSGKKPDWWCRSENSGYWHSSYPKHAKLYEVGLGGCSGVSSSKTLWDMMSCADSSGNACTAKHIVAALQNAATNRTAWEVLDVATVKAIWNEFAASSPNRYIPTDGVLWYADTPVLVSGQPGGLTGWLLTTMV